MTDYVAQFLANGGEVKKIATGARNYSNKQMREATGYEPEVVRHPNRHYEVMMLDECSTERCVIVSAKDVDDACDKATDKHPEGLIRSVELKGSRQARIDAEASARCLD